MKKVILLFVCILAMSFENQAQTVSDKDGNVYDTVHIGTQVWLKENLKTTKYDDGSAIPLITDSVSWIGLTSPGYCWYKNDSAGYKNPYGAFYNWYTVNTGKLCPTGWHVPSNEEWHSLVLFLDASAIDQYGTESTTAGDKLKEAGLTHWGKGNTGTNSSGFTALGAGFRNYYDKNYEGHTGVAYFWSSTLDSPNPTVWHRWMMNNSADVNEYLDQKIQGMSVRCLQDVTTGMNNINSIDNLILYPNPAKDRIMIENTEGIHRVLIYNFLGKLVLQGQMSQNRSEIDVSSLPNGIYVIKIETAQGTVEKKIIKE